MVFFLNFPSHSPISNIFYWCTIHNFFTWQLLFPFFPSSHLCVSFSIFQSWLVRLLVCFFFFLEIVSVSFSFWFERIERSTRANAMQSANTSIGLVLCTMPITETQQQTCERKREKEKGKKMFKFVFSSLSLSFHILFLSWCLTLFMRFSHQLLQCTSSMESCVDALRLCRSKNCILIEKKWNVFVPVLRYEVQ